MQFVENVDEFQLDVCHALKAAIRFLPETPFQQAREGRGPLEHGGLIVQHRRERFRERTTLKGARAGEQFVQQHAEAEDVAPRVTMLATRLFGRHVHRRARQLVIVIRR